MPLANPRSAQVEVGVPTLFMWSDGDVAVRGQTADACDAWVTAPYRFEVLPGVSHWMLDEASDDVARLLLEQFSAYPS
jgi:pimeloyl-ACP methyl ester carboxylesterase